MTNESTMIDMQVTAIRDLTPSIREFTLTPVAGGALPAAEPGAHVTVRTPSGAMRRYSLVRPGATPEAYVIAVKREPGSRGGSASMHDAVEVGTVLAIEPPENEFALSEAPAYLLIAGGVGVTPIYSMAQALEAEGKPFEIIYCTRSAEESAYLDELQGRWGAMLTAHHDGGDPDQVYDFWDHFEEPRDVKVFCCGPKPLMDEIQAISGHWPEGWVNFEDFKPVEVTRPDDVAFDVKLQASGKKVTVPADRSILEALREAGVATVSSCESGTCGTCKCRLIAGEADHRDMVLMDEEKDDYVLICVSRARSKELVLDL